MDAFDRGAASVARDAILKARAALDLMAPDGKWLELTRRCDPARMIRQLRSDSLVGVEREVTLECDRRRQRESGVGGWIPWETLAYRSARARMSNRADIVGSTTAGGYLVYTENLASAASSLLSMLVLGKLGCTAIDATGPNLTMAKVTASATPSWLTAETTQLTESEQTFGQMALNPHTVGGYTELSHLLTLQSRPDAGDLVSLDLSRKLARVIEQAAFTGPGSGGAPQGIVGLAGVGSTSGAAYTLATGLTSVASLGDALTDDASPGWAVNRTSAILLRGRQEFSGSPLTLWRGPVTWGQLHDFPAAGTSGVAAGDALFGCWAYLVLASWSPGLEISVNPFANFQAGIIGLRALATLDVGCVWPGAFSVVTGIT
jgi:HK97 family phage major capsid protein